MRRTDSADNHTERVHCVHADRNRLLGRVTQPRALIEESIHLVPCRLQRRVRFRGRPGEGQPRHRPHARETLRSGADAADDRSRFARSRGGEYRTRPVKMKMECGGSRGPPHSIFNVQPDST